MMQYNSLSTIVKPVHYSYFPRMAIRWRIQEMLDAKGWTAYRLAKEAGLTPSAVYKLLKKGDLRHVDADTLEALAAAFRCPPWELLTYRKH